MHPNYPIRPLQELVVEDFQVCTINGQVVPYEGWVELTVILSGHDDPNLTVQAPFIVSKIPLTQPLIGANVVGTIIERQESDKDGITLLINLLCRAFEMDEDQVTAMVHLIQVPQKTECRLATVRVGKDNLVIPADKVVRVWSRVPPCIDTTDSLVLYETAGDNVVLKQLSIGDGFLEINNTQRPYFKIPISNHTKDDITLARRTALVTIQHIAWVLETDSPEPLSLESIPTGKTTAHNSTAIVPDNTPAEPWLPQLISPT